MSITSEMIEQLRGELKALPPQRRRALTARDVVAELAPEIRAARVSGYTLADIAGQLRQRGVAISQNTLGSYLRGLGQPAADKSGGRLRRGKA